MDDIIIVNVKNKRFGMFIMLSGFALYSEGKGYLACKGKEIPYTPIGGRKALKEIMAENKIENLTGFHWVQEIKAS